MSPFLSDASCRSSNKWARCFSDLIFKWRISSPPGVLEGCLFSPKRFTEHRLCKFTPLSPGLLLPGFRWTLEIAILCWRFQTAWAERTPRVLNIPLLFSKWKVSSGILNCRNRSCRSSYLEYLITFEARLFKFRKLLADVCRWFIWEFSGLSGPGLLWISIWIVRSNQNRRPGSMSTVLPCLLSFEIEYLIAKTVDSIRFNDGLKNRPGKFRVPSAKDSPLILNRWQRFLPLCNLAMGGWNHGIS